MGMSGRDVLDQGWVDSGSSETGGKCREVEKVATESSESSD